MKRALAVILLTAFAGGLPLKWLCYRVCDSDHPVAAVDECHGAAVSAAQAVASGHDCGNHASPVAMLTKRVQPESQSLLVARVASALILRVSSLKARRSDFVFFDSSPPLARFLVPLRI
jgi:hypothetical protein